ncbi:translational GTPase TypA [Candidatus Woesebacteria bacterium CG_4_10_14_0_2_um_filter_39_14]|uniref:50S ribosomal subunit assembly factor BipA n=3 Tax=Microgenomates group TaxID=1794810 RepID=A0A2M6YQ67_9BACT|nr:MAG: translational GTPase TypA [Candidatus Shapirobacteria bacterium CG07_land_8_20_14_0_80_39_12]PIZ49470.1 MAG: translational GTPase TypA [Candidatus Woesebacteria bacterium CG_4_10_14_0_2_um_filter_39_14]PJA49437.1 MAG: translational GTPase TypA [Candidatus Shapirobacteria bacterium CG_4_9_14_3_um_filter_39_13]
MKIRNIAIISHVDHGKTTLVDSLLRQSKTHLNKDVIDSSCIMDSNELEKERGITIFSKNASVVWQETKINIIDTPGHADFGGEVERVLKMADGSLLLIDAQEGPMPQTRFVLKKALELKHKIIVVINKIDKPNANVSQALNKTFDLFIDLGADEETTNFPVIYASSKMGKAGLTPDLSQMKDITPLFEEIVKYIPQPSGDKDLPLQMLVTSINWDNFKGRIARGRMANGTIKAGQEVMHINREGQMKKYRLTSLVTFQGLGQNEVKEAEAGEIVAIAGIPEIMIGETIADVNQPQALPLLEIEEPTLKMTFNVSSSPFAGKEGQFTTSRQIRERLYKELDNDVALKVEDEPQGGWVVSGRGELHLAILIERLRREGYEFQVSQPQVIVKIVDNQKMVPYEEVFIDVPEKYSGAVIQKLGNRLGLMKKMEVEEGTAHLEFIISTRGLFGYRREFMTDTRGLGLINTLFHQYLPAKGEGQARERGSLIACETGITRLYGLTNIQGRGELFVGPGTNVYKGQVVGQNSRQEDIWVNVCKEKQLSNMRSKGDGSMEHFNVPRVMGLDDALEYIDQTELVEATPKSIRIRKIILDELEEKRRKKGLTK